MKLYKNAFVSTIFLLLVVSIFPAFSFAENKASGSLTVDGDKTEIKYAYAEEYDGDITIGLFDNEVPDGMFPDGIYNLGEQGKLKGIVFVVSSDKKELMSGGLYNLMNAIHSYPKWNKLGTIGNGKLTAKMSDGDSFSGTIKTPSENDVEGHKFAYEIKFSVNLKKEPQTLTMTGKSNAPSKAFGEWGAALFAGDIEEYKKHTSKDVLAMMPEDATELKEGIEFQQLVFPNNIEIVSSDIEGDKAILKAKGTKGAEVSIGNVTMVKEDGLWKVSEQSWESGSN